jgi:hypothetical protein
LEGRVRILVVHVDDTSPLSQNKEVLAWLFSHDLITIKDHN